MAFEPKGSGPRFFRELYWFVVICLAGWIVAMAIVPPRASRYWTMLQLEAKLRDRTAELEERSRVLSAAYESMEQDPLYRECVWREVLGVKRESEIYLQPPEVSVR